MRRFTLVDGNILEKTWANNPDGEHLGDLIQRLKEKHCFMDFKNRSWQDSRLEIKIHDSQNANAHGMTLYEFSELVERPEWAGRWFNGQMQGSSLRLTCCRTYDETLLMELKLVIGRRAKDQLLLFWQVKYLDADSCEISEVCQRMAEKDLINILIERVTAG